MRTGRTAAAGLLAALTLTLASCAQTPGSGGGEADGDYPSKPVSMVVAWSAGGGTDIMTRAFTQSAAEHLGQQMNVVNKPGSSGAIGWGEIARSTAADGYTLSIVSPEISFLREQGLYDFGLEDFTLITMINQDPAALAVRADAPWDTVEEFVTAAKAEPAGLSIGNSGPGLAWDLATAAIEREADIEVTRVPYDGAAAAAQAVLGGDLDAMSFSIGEVSAQVAAGEMKVLGVASAERLETLPELPTFTEQGYDVEIGTFRGVAGPAGMDPAVVSTLNDAFVAMADEPGFVDVMNSNSFGIDVRPTAEFQQFFEESSELYVDLLQDGSGATS
ncbi:tripartite-type tricarboxylate transporter receptor subunit TctC [Pseudonocardia autotrophica]|uniref:Tripartite tricarboxylate transporter family receptor n=2 Tax=Pseudonocardia TaxID=1847 RepID=A0A1Y2MMN0_PSEAH|nr:Tripartite tricarboxylate transporter family receptor [Pseudonocardia autotrophica]TDN73047.1 tripartite-type tricarboxylate transporter receptor subunit TctC [Pseudonocardia autotrophica]